MDRLPPLKNTIGNMLKFVCLFALLASSAAAASEADSLLTSALKMVKDCGERSMVLCMKVNSLQPVANKIS